MWPALRFLESCSPARVKQGASSWGGALGLLRGGRESDSSRIQASSAAAWSAVRRRPSLVRRHSTSSAVYGPLLRDEVAHLGFG